ncbi:hypothetical protein QL285_003212 [Trifolium repens]|nr:hypothetical protein QL285_003212 [Trifolium repens]
MLDSVELTRSKSIGWLELTGAVCMTFNLEYIERESKKLSLSRHCFFPLPLKGRIDSPLPSSVPRAILLVHNRKGGSKEMQLLGRQVTPSCYDILHRAAMNIFSSDLFFYFLGQQAVLIVARWESSCCDGMLNFFTFWAFSCLLAS